MKYVPKEKQCEFLGIPVRFNGSYWVGYSLFVSVIGNTQFQCISNIEKVLFN